ncbi:hypothetical protein [Dongia rigui]|uniref:Uncharacterized protein n=1 Tax=Dongia rigui TaxID=940149 RepID=A0ABU5DZY7_9PROT|nr:hypothetical protein [Dongia rigui]MDY0872524.1 hypothetical protein [Dongia rigui]
MNAATVTAIIQGVAALAPYLAQLGALATKVRSGDTVTDGDLRLAEEARRRAFAALRAQLTETAN